ncbi:hypothetical protein [Streptomyces flaveolus]|uniref:hypothetical protein n=1 Tax=Streptomyces flaveolus TaxID=67297 RepID=UPI00331C0D4A
MVRLLKPVGARRRKFLSCAGLAAITLVGCGNAADQGASRLYPFRSAVYFTVAETAALHTAEENAVEHCMRRHGFAYTPTPSPVARWEPDNPYGLLKESQARVDGYGITSRMIEQRGETVSPQDHSPTRVPDRIPKETAASERWRRALLGSRQQAVELPGDEEVSIPANGCVAESRRHLYGADWERLYYLFQALSNMVIVETNSNPSVRVVQNRWADCMKEAGYPVASLEEARARVTRQVEDAGRAAGAVRTVARSELRTAVADARCQQRVNLRGSFEAAQRKAERELVKRFGSDLARLEDLRARAVAKASTEATQSSSRSD